VRELTTGRDESADELERNYLSWSLLSYTSWRGGNVTAEFARLSAWAETFDDPGAREAPRGLRAEIAFAAGDFRIACDEWLAFAASDTLNAPTAAFSAGLAGLMALEADRAAAALAAHEATGRHGRLHDLDRRLLRAGLLGLAGRRAEALREGRAVLVEYDRLGLRFRQAAGSLVLLAVVGGHDSEIRELADMSRAIFERLGAKPFLLLLDQALAGTPDPGPAARAVAGRRLPDASVATP